MTNTTETFWDVDGVSLHTYAFNIETLGGDRAAPPPVRGDDVLVPYLPGTRFVPKVPDARVMTLGMWVIGANEDGTVPDDGDARLAYEYNWRMLRKLLWRYRTQFTLTKRFWVPTQDLVDAGVSLAGKTQRGSNTLIEASAKAAFHSGLAPAMDGPARARFTVDLRLSDPYFYGEQVTIPFSTSTAPGDPGPTQTRKILGDDRTTDITFALEGPLTAPQFTVTSDSVNPYIRYATVIADGDDVMIDVKRFRAQHTDTLSTYWSSGYVSHYGDRPWFYLDPDDDATIALTVQSGTGVGALTYRPAWL